MKKLAVILLFLISLGGRAQSVAPAVRLDSAKITARNATPEKEREIFSDKDYVYHADAQESTNWLKAFWEWLTEQLFGKLSVENADLTWKIVKWTLIGLFIAGIIFILWRSNFRGLLRGKPKNLAGAAFTDLPEDIESVNIDNLISEALKNGNYRLAIRWSFLKSLQLLNQRKHIVWQPAKTNIDYQYELTQPALREDFRKLSYVFEYVWYGEMATNESVFARYRTEIDKFNSNLHA